jgi:hypothetical protein
MNRANSNQQTANSPTEIVTFDDFEDENVVLE